MNDEIPEGWVPIPHAVEPAIAPGMVDAFLETASQVLPGLVVDDDSRRLTIDAFARLPVEQNTFARLWNLLGPSATGLLADLSVTETAQELTARAGGPFSRVHIQRLVPFADGLLSLAFVAPDAASPPALLMRAQRREEGRVLTADVLTTDAPLLGLIMDDLIRIVGGEPSRDGITPEDDEDHPPA